jgi:hypothetical protein
LAREDPDLAVALALEGVVDDACATSEAAVLRAYDVEISGLD